MSTPLKPEVSAFASMKRALQAEQKADRLEKEVKALEGLNATQGDTISGLVQSYLDTDRRVRAVEQNGLTVISALVRAAGGTVKVPKVFLEDNTGVLDNDQDPVSHALTISWRPTEPEAEAGAA